MRGGSQHDQAGAGNRVLKRMRGRKRLGKADARQEQGILPFEIDAPDHLLFVGPELDREPLIHQMAGERGAPGPCSNNRGSMNGRQRNRHGFRYGKVERGVGLDYRNGFSGLSILERTKQELSTVCVIPAYVARVSSKSVAFYETY